MRRLAAPWLLAVLLVSCGAGFSLPFGLGSKLEMSGTVYDAATKEPLEGVLVLVTYEHIRSGWAASVSVCDKVRTVTTGKDGKFRFPVERRDGKNPGYPYAFLAGYYHKDHARVESDVLRDRDIYLARQQPGNHIHWVASGGREPCSQSEIKNPDEAKALESFLALVRAEQDKGIAERKPIQYSVKVTAFSQGCYAYDKSESFRCCVQIPDADAFKNAEAAFKKENLALSYGSESFQLCVRTQDRIVAARLAADALYP